MTGETCSSCAGAYMLVSWPDSQEYMDMPWFAEEAVLHLDEPSAYFIPLRRIRERQVELEEPK